MEPTWDEPSSMTTNVHLGSGPFRFVLLGSDAVRFAMVTLGAGVEILCPHPDRLHALADSIRQAADLLAGPETDQ